jgi:hypothetical protein
MKYKLKFVLNGNPFEMPTWSVEKHEKLLELMIPYDEEVKLKTLSQKDYDKKYRCTMILLSLNDIDPKVKESDLQTLHPDDFIDLWIAAYNSGKQGITVKDSDFQKGEQSPQQK